MRRRDFLKTAGVAAAAGVATGRLAHGAPAVISGFRDITIAASWADGSAGFSDIAFQFSRKLQHALGGGVNVRLETIEGSALDVLASGAADLHIGFLRDSLQHEPAFAAFAGLPGDLGLAHDYFSAWLHAGGQELWNGVALGHGLKQAALLHTGGAQNFWTRTPLISFAGLKISAQGLERDVLKGLGADVSADTDGAMSDHSIDALARKLPSAYPHCAAGGITRGGNTIAISMPVRVYETLATSSGNALETLFADFYGRMSAQLRAEEFQLRRVMEETRAASIAPLARKLSLEISRVSEAVVADYAGKSRPAAIVNASYMAFKERIARETV